jgi:Ni/Co efflux regulator RcnB
MKRAVTAGFIASLFLSGVAMADPPDHRDHDDHPGADHEHDAHDKSHGNSGHEGHDNGQHHGRYKVGDYRHPKGYQHRAWHKGERLPSTYRTKVYVVEDYPRYELRSPPRGYYWVRVDNDVVLAAIATGVVLEVVSDIFF